MLEMLAIFCTGMIAGAVVTMFVLTLISYRE